MSRIFNAEKEILFIETQFIYHKNTNESASSIIPDESLQLSNHLTFISSKFIDKNAVKKTGIALTFFYVVLILVFTKVAGKLGLIVF